MNKIKVMIVDDSAVVRQVLTSYLEASKEVEIIGAASDPIFAIEKMQKEWPDVIILDVEMPRMDGFELVRNIRGDSRTANIPLLIISSRTAEKHRSLARELGVNAYLGKPVQDDELLAQVKALLDAH